MSLKRVPLGTRFLWTVMLYSSVLTLLFVLVNLYARYDQEMSELQQRVKRVETTVMPALQQAVWDLDQPQLELQLLGITRIPDVVSARLVTSEGSITTIGHPNTRDNSIVIPVRRGGQELGQLDIGVSYQRIYDELWQHAEVLVLSQGVRTFLVSMLLVVLVNRMITRHLEDISGQIKDHKSRFTLARKPQRNDELSTLINALNQLSAEREQQLSALAESKAQLDNQHQLLEKEVAEQTQALRQENDLAIMMGELAANLLEQPYEKLDRGLQQAVTLIGRQLGVKSVTLFEQVLVKAHWPTSEQVWPLWSTLQAQQVLRDGQHFYDQEAGVLALPLKDQGLNRGALMVTGNIDKVWMEKYFTHLHRFTSFVAALLVRQQATQLFTPIEWQRKKHSLWQDEKRGKTALAAMADQQAQAGSYLTVLLWEFSGQEPITEPQLAELRATISHGMPDTLFVQLSTRLLMVAVAGTGPQAINTLVSALMTDLKVAAAPLKVRVGGFCLKFKEALPYDKLIDMADGALFQARNQATGLVIETNND
ncbi:hypothetical protein [Gallaecimonas mangrovi]|uniref:hypothetical protein n=1 Tax=Gallaecimonas mangrovi TaxID=2291597 RepID=UPI000E1FB7E0|nr:hypothetical protein [Gallaecimonas mangrovi]